MSVGNREWGVGNRQGAPAPAARFCESRISNPCFQQTNVRSSRHQSGFSLIEVIAAILLLAIAFTALMQVAGASVKLTQNAAEHSEAALWARSKLDSVFVGQALQPGSTSGQFNAKFRWQLDVTPWTQAGAAPPNAPLHLYQLDLDVLWGPQAHPKSAHFRTLRLTGPETGNAQAGP
jgi:general secretion pathway protein I